MSQVECSEMIDVAIVGAGPAGLGAGLYAARAGLRTVVFGDRYESQLARAEIVENYPAQIEPLSGIELVEMLAQHAARFSAEFTDQEIRQIKREGNLFHLFTSGGECHPAYAVVLAMGTKRRQLGVPGEQEFYGLGVAYCTICDGPLFREMPVAVIGFGEEGAAAALRMNGIASSVDLIVPRPELGADQMTTDQLRDSPKVTILEGAKVLEILGNAAGVSGVKIAIDDQERIRPVRGVFLEVGLLPASALAIDLGVAVNEDHFIEVEASQNTNVLGIFAAGDITGHRARQTVISAGEGATAAVAAVDYIKSNGLGGERKLLKLIQWGATPAAESTGVEPETGAGSTAPPLPANALLEYIRGEEVYQQDLSAYSPDLAIVERIKEAMPRARVVVIAAAWCPDCRRNVPRIARISELLPDWDFTVYSRESDMARELGVMAIPTIALFDPETDQELGRIVEDPRSDSIERDLLEIVQGDHDLFVEC